MATTTPNFGWPVPTSTDLVKDGATAMEALGDAIDTSMVDLKGGTTGQILSKASSADMDFSWTTPNPGDITGVTAGTGISGGGTSGDVTITNSMATTITTKGDLVPGTGSGTFARLAAGSNGETLVADSSTATGLRYQGNYAAGKNAIINGDFGIWQRGTTFNAAASGTWTADRWQAIFVNGTVNVTQQAFTAGTAPVAGYEGKYFWQLARTSTAGVNDYYATKIEDVRTFAGQTVTYSFWAKSSSASKSIIFYLSQNFGTGGSSAVDIAPTTAVNLTTSWARYSATFTVPSIAGKTIGTGSYLAPIFALQIADGNNTWSIWGVQLEAGSVATSFQTATGNPASELAACQRYYEKSFGQATAPSNTASSGGVNRAGTAYSTAGWRSQTINYAVVKRTNPTLTFYKTSNSSTNGRWAYYTTSWQTSTATAVSNANEVAFSVEVTGTYTSNAGYIVDGEWDSNAEL